MTEINYNSLKNRILRGENSLTLDEQEHFDWVKQHLNLINVIGYENYLIEQMDD